MDVGAGVGRHDQFDPGRDHPQRRGPHGEPGGHEDGADDGECDVVLHRHATSGTPGAGRNWRARSNAMMAATAKSIFLTLVFASFTIRDPRTSALRTAWPTWRA